MVDKGGKCAEKMRKKEKKHSLSRSKLKFLEDLYCSIKEKP